MKTFKEMQALLQLQKAIEQTPGFCTEEDMARYTDGNCTSCGQFDSLLNGLCADCDTVEEPMWKDKWKD